MQKTNNKKIWLHKLMLSMEKNSLFSMAKRSFMLLLPIVLIGNFAYIIANLPLPAYLEFINAFLGGAIKNILVFIHSCTISIISFYVVFSIAYVYARRYSTNHLPHYLSCAITCYIILSVSNVEDAFSGIFAPENFLMALLASFGFCFLMRQFIKFTNKFILTKTTVGFDMDFQLSLASILPIILCIITALVVKTVFYKATGLMSFNLLIELGIEKLFAHLGFGVLGAIVYMVLNSVFYIFGMHSGYVFTSVITGFYINTSLNSKALESGVLAESLPHIVNSTFLNSFVFLGGAGASICLVLALIIHLQKSSYEKRLFKLSIIPSIFNVSEIIWLSFPLIFNPIMLIPFILTPIALFTISYFATALHLVPICTQITHWMNPIIFSGYMATDSISGVILQIVCLVVGVVIYYPFIKICTEVRLVLSVKNIEELTDVLKEKERTNSARTFKNCDKRIMGIANSLTYELKNAFKKNELQLYYQPQINNDSSLYGVEALLRWNHPVAGNIYPPVIITLAYDDDFLDDLGFSIIDLACKTLERLVKSCDQKVRLSVNISPTQLENKYFYDKVKNIINKYDFGNGELCFEITEQVALSNTALVTEQICKLRELGISFHMDDFGMGHSSMLYLQSNEFEAVKLDGSLVKDMAINKRSQNIVAGINEMSKSLKYDMIAEYVETTEQKELLKQMGCEIYQGYLFSPPLPLPLLEEYLSENKMINENEKPITKENLFI